MALTGPAGGTYSLNDGDGGYGTVPTGMSRDCVDCYEVAVSGTRPALHWDAVGEEALLPDVQGQRKRWSLHMGDSFDDVVRDSAFYPFVEAMLHHGITGGCGGISYCPLASTTRAQMAVFVLVAKEGPSYAVPPCVAPPFADVPISSVFCPWIAEVSRRGVSAGCGGGNYCPGMVVSRQEMAVFALAALDPTFTPPPCTAPPFSDVPASSIFCPHIAELQRRGVLSGCGGGAFCPAAAVGRQEMAVFISGTFGLTLYGP